MYHPIRSFKYIRNAIVDLLIQSDRLSTWTKQTCTYKQIARTAARAERALKVAFHWRIYKNTSMKGNTEHKRHNGIRKLGIYGILDTSSFSSNTNAWLWDENANQCPPCWVKNRIHSYIPINENFSFRKIDRQLDFRSYIVRIGSWFVFVALWNYIDGLLQPLEKKDKTKTKSRNRDKFEFFAIWITTRHFIPATIFITLWLTLECMSEHGLTLLEFIPIAVKISRHIDFNNNELRKDTPKVNTQWQRKC